MNIIIDQQCNNIDQTIKFFLQSCKLAAQKNDGRITASEQRAIGKMEKKSIAYIAEIKKIAKTID